MTTLCTETKQLTRAQDYQQAQHLHLRPTFDVLQWSSEGTSSDMFTEGGGGITDAPVSRCYT